MPGAFGARRTAGRGEGALSPTGTPRAGRRVQAVTTQRSFLDKYRSRLIALGIIVAVVVVGAFVFIGGSQPAYACSLQEDPASPAPSGAPVTGQRQDDQGRGHLAVGTSVTYTYCPPASGKHYNASNEGPIAPRFYSPDDNIIPQNWIHNLEHGGIVILYNCARTACDTASLDQLRQLPTNFPASPICHIAGGLISPVIARFDTMKANYAAVVWDRVLYQDKLDVPQILEFFKNEGEKANPEQQCNPSASPGASGAPGASQTPIAPMPSGS